MPERLEYRYGDDLFVKEIEGNRATFLKNGKPLSLKEWNLEINRYQSMSVKETHPNPAVRLIERLRRLSLLVLARPARNSVVADIGCESGFIAEVFRPRCRRLLLVDIDRDLLDRARDRLGNERIRYVQSDISRIDLPDGAANITIASEILEHVPDERVALSEACRVTRTGGRVIISVPNDRLILWIKRAIGRVLRKRFLAGLADGLAIGHLRLYTKSSLARLCAEFGTVRAVYYAPPFFLNIHAAFTPHSRRT